MKVHEEKKHGSNSDSSRSQKSSPNKSKNAFSPTNPASMGYQPVPMDGNFQAYANQSQGYPMQQENVIYSKCNVKSAPNTIPKLKLKLTKPFSPVVARVILQRFAFVTCKKILQNQTRSEPTLSNSHQHEIPVLVLSEGKDPYKSKQNGSATRFFSI